ncbi:hypothetical protein L1887_28928 [Cichorium endivia]|nr:hypothetical protein L1887_28928 [Cichorium endivia]
MKNQKVTICMCINKFSTTGDARKKVLKEAFFLSWISRFSGRLMTCSKIRRLRIHLGDLIVAGKGKYLQFVILIECMATYLFCTRSLP